MGLAVAFDLRHLHDRLVTDARFGVGRVHRPPVTGLGREHETIAQIAVVRDGEDLAAGQLLVSVHVLPEGLRILAVEGGKRNDLLHAVDAVAENDGAMEVVALGRRCPFKAVQRGENAGIVEFLDRLGGLRPGPRRELRIVDFRLVEENGIDGFPRGLEGHLRALLIHVVPFLACRVGEQRRVAATKLIGQTQVFGMVGDREPVQRPVQSDFQAAVDGDDFAPGVAEHVGGQQRHSGQSCVGGEAGMDVGRAPENPVREVLVDKRGIVLGRFLCRPGDLPDVRFDRRAAPHRGQQHRQCESGNRQSGNAIR